MTPLDELNMATENLCDIQSQSLYRALMTEVGQAERRGKSEQQIMEQLILVLVIVGLSYEQNFSLIKAVMEIYRVTVKRLAQLSAAEA
tara:strand:- start:1260 stop:1523 length:264 start_codon:yes stop_codon:yes gene_type:complete